MDKRNVCVRPTRRAVLNAAVAALAAGRTLPALPLQQGIVPVGPGNPRNTTDDPRFETTAEPANSPMGVGKGINPGRVVWAHQPKATRWDGETGNWWDDEATDGRLIAAMLSETLRTLSGEKSDKRAWDSLFKFYNQTHKLSNAGYRPGEKIVLKVNSNQDRPGAWRFGAGMNSPQVFYALVHQLITEAGVKGQDITLYDASRYIGDPIFNKIRSNPDPNFQAVRFVVNERMAGSGRVPAAPDKTSPLNFSGSGVPTAYLPQCVTEAKYMINVALPRAHTLMGYTGSAKNQFGSIYFEGQGFTPRPVHDWAARDLPMGSYNCLVDLIAHKHLGGKTVLYLHEFLYVSESQGGRVIKFQSMGDQWCSSLFASQDPVAIDSVALDFVRNEPKAKECRGKPENYLHEAALAEAPPSKTVYDPDKTGKVASLGVHEHWNNPTEKKYSRNLGKREGIELVALRT
ncbi:MAG: DUF362 domain-containing protein [Bryobacteraceae bacterium]